MTKDEYIKSEFVEQFIEWMSEKLGCETFAQSYWMRKRNRQWSCTSVFDAYEKYDWPHRGVEALGVPAGHTFESNSQALEALQKALVDALLKNDDKRACEILCALMGWGGVRAGNASWLTANEAGLAGLVATMRDVLNAGCTEHSLLASNKLRFNSGMSKAYSLVCNEFVIYDSRVAAALGMAIVEFCIAKKLKSVPAELQFPWAPARSASNAVNPPLRDPRQGPFDFPRLAGAGAKRYASWNLRASWLLAAIAKRASGGDSGFARIESDASRLRALEAALFMIGYDLVRSDQATGDPEGVVSVDPAPKRPRNQAGEWIEGFTPSHENRFEYRIEEDRIKINSPLAFRDARVNATVQILYAQFGTTRFPLANNRDKVRDGTEKKGVGMAYKAAGGSNAPDTSKLSAILEEYEVFVPCFNAPGAVRHWTLNTEALGLVDGKVNIRRWLNERRNDE
ncbi:hypothetical protein [Paraburkholderia bannensis]|uniref:hypothetical protein n=1 Tax=Paraburkholderia bannensis TaxID=765414 RepID=UPI002AB72C21|nr:hypothetical protein [Paraburkholderia bannensis]